jgi:hypothetical protein
MTITLGLWQIAVLTLLIPIAIETLRRLVILTVTVLRRHWSGQSRNETSADDKSHPSAGSNESGSVSLENNVIPFRSSITGANPSGVSFTEHIGILGKTPASKPVKGKWLRKVGR